MNKSCKTKKDNDIIDQSVTEKHITDYIHGIGLILTYIFIFLFFADVVVTVFVYFGYFNFHLRSIKGGEASYAEFLAGQIIIQVLISIPFIIYFLLYNKTNFSQKKTLLCMLTILSTTILCFGHWKNSYISFLYAIPVIITSPLDRKRNVITLCISETMVILYAFYHNFFNPSEINILVAAVATTTIITFFLISIKIHSTINNIFEEVKEFKVTQNVLFDKIAHDVLTGAYSKSALENDMEKFDEFKSIAFLDIDDFKNINDDKGHGIGDNFLKLLVICVKSKKNIDIYRYGGDEFIVLSKEYSSRELCNIFEVIRKRFFYASRELYSSDGTISVGIMNIDHEKSAEYNIRKCDELMYKSKNQGKNRITVQE